jgi:hypothetical protein
MLSSPSLQTQAAARASALHSVLRGSVRNAHLRYRFQLRWDGATLEGRLGGRFIGERLRLQGNANELLGTVTGGIGNLAVRASHDAEKLCLRVVGGCGELSAETDLRSGKGTLQHGGSSGSFVVEPGLGLLSLRFSDTETVRLERIGNAPDWVSIAAALLTVIVTREINRAQLEALREMGEL